MGHLEDPNVCHLLVPLNLLKSGQYALCVLNQPVANPTLLVNIWNKAQYRVTVDGGTSIWSNIVNNTIEQITVENPDLITGDFDSADQAHIQHFKGWEPEWWKLRPGSDGFHQVP
eukprot:TRINITY_DN33930_c0_g1_i1.p1 TRINITY_DN33930_c0_g1~~TRINITY_DN33930_c0_g1_i1.p1  ORF type:complete len:123 (+),score=52.48 TRINITY_DN33930_c0_g1_i1:27-371(+)